jgi:glycosyltransferase involved in cell wall biosynthesis
MILFYIPNFRPGGAERVIITLANYLFSKGVKIIFLVNKSNGQFKIFLDKRITVVELNSKSVLGSILPFIKVCRKLKPKIVFACLGPSVTVSVAKLFLSKKISIVNRLGNTIGEEMKHLGYLKKFKYFLAQNIIGLNSDILIFQSKIMLDDFNRIVISKPKSVRIIHNPLDLKGILTKSQEKAESYDLIAVGRLTKQKDYHTMLEALKILVRSGYKDISLGIIGIGDLEISLKKKVQDLNLVNNVTFLGYKENPYKYIGNAKFLILSSLYEGLPNVVLESLYLNTPVISTDCPSGIKEFFKEGYHGYYAKTGSPDSLASSINKGLENIEKFKNKNNKEEISLNFGIEVIGEKYLEILK